MRQIANSVQEMADGVPRANPQYTHGQKLLSVGVIVDLFRGSSAGGHVKTWERIAHAACGEPVDLTIYFLGKREIVLPLSDNVRYVELPPMWSTGSLGFLKGIPANTDLAPLHVRALRHFKKHDVLHVTDAYFSMARSARIIARRSRLALVHSAHTETPGYTRIYTDQVIRRVFGSGWLARHLCERWKLPERLEERMQRQLQRYLRSCDWSMTSDERDGHDFSGAAHWKRASILRRGIDSEMFHPNKRDRQRLEREYGIPPNRAVLLFVGRIDRGKDVITVARAARMLLDSGHDVQLICAGQGSQMGDVRELLGSRVTLPGQLSEEILAWLYASADVFVFSSRIEIFPNVVLEAKASGLPVVVSAHGGSGRLARDGHGELAGLTISENQPDAWAGAIADLLNNPERRRTMGEAARREIESSWPSWRQILREDLMPVWQRVARKRQVLP